MTIDIRRALKKFAPNFIQAREDGLTEADTVDRVCLFFEEVLGYERLNDISHEVPMKNKFIDVCLKIDDRVRLIVEVKRAGQQLRDRHIEQAQIYASQNNYPWVLLTNGVDWHLYHLTFEEGIDYEKAFIVSLDTDEELEDAAEKLAILHKQSIKKDELEIFWGKAAALGPSSIAKALFTEDVLKRLRQEIHRETGLLIDPEDLANSIQEMLSPEAREKIGPMRIHKRRRSSRKAEKTEQEESATNATPQPNSSQNTDG